MLVYHISIISGQKEEIPALIIHHKKLPIFNMVSIHHYVTLFCLSENLLKSDGRKFPTINQIIEHLPRSHTGKLRTVSHKNQVSSGYYSLKQSIKQMHIYH